MLNNNHSVLSMKSKREATLECNVFFVQTWVCIYVKYCEPIVIYVQCKLRNILQLMNMILNLYSFFPVIPEVCLLYTGYLVWSVFKLNIKIVFSLVFVVLDLHIQSWPTFIMWKNTIYLIRQFIYSL